MLIVSSLVNLVIVVGGFNNTVAIEDESCVALVALVADA